MTDYDGQRRPATSKVVQANRQEGPTLCQNLVQERAPDGFTNLENVVSQPEFAEIATRYRRGAGFDPSTLNDRPALSVRVDV